MKKLFLTINLCLMTSLLFATSYNDSVTVTSTVGTISLSEAAADNINGGELGLYKIFVDSTSNSTNQNKTLELEDVSTTGVSAYFRIYQFAKVRTNEQISLKLEGEPLTNTDASITENNKTSTPVFSEFTDTTLKGTNSEDIFKVTHSKIDSADNKIKFDLNYCDNKYVIKDTNISLFKGSWAKNENLAPGDYSSTIKVTYEIN